MEFNLNQIQPQEVKVKILLTGGHEYNLWFKAEDPLLRNFLEAVFGRHQQQTLSSDQWLQIPIDGGRAALSFPRSSLVGVVTEPGIFIQYPSPVNSQQTQQTDVIVSPYLQFDNFLTEEEKAQLLAYALERESDFVPTGPLTNPSQFFDYRNSLVLFYFSEFSEFFISRLQKVIPDVLSKLGMPSFPISQIEAQLTAHNDNNYYRTHTDNSTPPTATRELTYTYYFYREPKSFSGGELRIYDSRLVNSNYVKAESFKTIEPRNNSIVFFPSRCYHEVLPVNCPSKAFADSRFTINGWVRREESRS